MKYFDIELVFIMSALGSSRRTKQYNLFTKGPVTLRRIAPTYADIWKIQQERWYTLSTLEISFKHVTNTL